MTTLTDYTVTPSTISKYLSRYNDVIIEYKANIDNGRDISTVTNDYLVHAKKWIKNYVSNTLSIDRNFEIDNAEKLEDAICYNIIYRAFLDTESFPPQTKSEDERQVLFQSEVYKELSLEALQAVTPQLSIILESTVISKPASTLRFYRG